MMESPQSCPLQCTDKMSGLHVAGSWEISLGEIEPAKEHSSPGSTRVETLHRPKVGEVPVVRSNDKGLLSSLRPTTRLFQGQLVSAQLPLGRREIYSSTRQSVSTADEWAVFTG